MRKRKKSNSKFKSRAMILSGLVVLSGLGAAIGFATSAQATGTTTSLSTLDRASSVTANGLSDYWKSLGTTKLISSSSNIQSFIQQNGAIFRNLVASKEYLATSAVNLLVSTSNQIDFSGSAKAKEESRVLVKNTIQSNNKKFYDYMTAPIADADEFISRLALAKDVYPEMYNKFIREFSQAYNIWVNPAYSNPTEFNSLLPTALENFENRINTDTVLNNYRNFYTSQAEPVYKTLIDHLGKYSFGHNYLSETNVLGQITDGVDPSTYGAIHNKRLYMSAASLAAVFNGTADFETASRAINSTRASITSVLTALWAKRYKSISLAIAAYASPCSLFCGIAAASVAGYQRSDYISQGRLWDYASHRSSYVMRNILTTTGDQLTDKVSINYAGTERNAYVNTYIHGDQQEMNFTQSAATNWQRGVNNYQQAVGNNGSRAAQRDIPAYVNELLRGASNYWQSRIAEIKKTSPYAYFNDFITSANGFESELKNVWFDKIFYETLEQTTQIQYKKIEDTLIANNDSIHKTALDFINLQTYDYSTARNQQLYNQVKNYLSEDYRVGIFRAELQKNIQKYSTQLNTRTDKILADHQEDAKTDFDELKPKLEKLLITNFNDENFVVENSTSDQLGQERLTLKKADGTDSPFSYIPTGNTPGANDPVKAEYTSKFITNNIILRSFISRESEIAEILQQRSTSALLAYREQLFTILERDIYDYVKPSLDAYAKQNETLFDEYLNTSKQGVDMRLNTSAYDDFVLKNVATQKDRNNVLFKLQPNSVTVAEGFLLQVLDVNNYNDPKGELKTIFEFLSDDASLQDYITKTSLDVARN